MPTPTDERPKKRLRLELPEDAWGEARRDFFSGAPIDHIFSFLSPKDLGRLGAVSRRFYSECRDALTPKAAKQLLEHVVKGEEDKAFRMIDAMPWLLLVKATTQDYSGRIIEGTAFQAALGAHDSIMANKMLRYFDKMDYLQEGAVTRQFDEVFPEGVEAQFLKEQENAYDFKALIEAIRNGQKVEDALAEFREVMTAQKHIKNGSHFNIHHLINAYDAYVTHLDALGNQNNRKLFWQKVIGFIQRQIPANYAQAHCSGLKSASEWGSFQRTLKIKFADDDFFPLAQDAGLGFRIGCYSYHNGALNVADPSSFELMRWGSEVLPSVLDNFVETKTRDLVDLRRQLEAGLSFSPR